MRITSTWLAERMLTGMQRAQGRMVEEQAHVASGKRITRPSDDPFGTGRVLGLLTRAGNNGQYQRNVAVAGQDLTATEAAIASLHDVLARAYELAVQAANGNLTPGDRSKVAVEVSQLLNQAVAIGNTAHGDRYLFAGHRTNVKPFVEDVPGNPTVVNYMGDSGLIQREIAQNERLHVNVPGDQLFPSVFTTLIQFRDALNANAIPAVQAASGQLQSCMDAALSTRSDVGLRMRRVEAAGQRLEDEEALLETMRSSIEDVDLSEAIIRLESHETAYQAALAASARTLDLSLLDFLR